MLPPLDLDKFRTVTLGDAVIEREILAEFRITNPKDDDTLRDAIRRGDSIEVQSSAHRIKGAAWVIAAVDLVATCEALENAAKANPRLVREIKLTEFELALERVYDCVDRLLGKAETG